MYNEIITFDVIKIEKGGFDYSECLININNVDINIIIISDNVPFDKKCFKYFIDYRDYEKVKLIRIEPQKMSVHTKRLDEGKNTSFFSNNDELLEKCHNIWDKANNIIKKRFDNEPVYIAKFLTNKAKSFEGQINTNFLDDGMLKEGSYCICLSVILIDSVFKIGEKYYPSVFLHISDDLEISSDSFDKKTF